MNTYTQGQKVYSSWGQEAEYVAKTPNGHAVLPLFEDEHEGFIRYDQVREWPEIYLNPPTDKLNEEVLQLQKKKTELQDELSVIRKQRAEENDAIKSQLTKLKRHKALEFIEEFLDGKITHYVKICDYGGPFEIKALSETIAEDYGYKKGEFKLLSLFGSSNGELQWKLNHYKDGSGTYTHVFPVTSYESAIVKATEFAEARWLSWRDSKKGELPRMAEACDKHKIPVPQDIREAIATEKITNAQFAYDKKKQELLVVEAQLKSVLQGENKTENVEEEEL